MIGTLQVHRATSIVVRRRVAAPTVWTDIVITTEDGSTVTVVVFPAAGTPLYPVNGE